MDEVAAANDAGGRGEKGRSLTNGDGSNRLKLEALCRTGARLQKAFPRGKGDREERAVDEGYIIIVPFVIH